jgi:KDO2-lipid IV(A) lauroyltransferase
MKKIRYIFEAIFAYLIFGIFRILGLKLACRLGSLIARNIGPQLKVHKIARSNIARALPKLTEDDIETTLTGMWHNMGSTVGALPFLRSLTGKKFEKHVTVKGIEHLDKAYEAKNGVVLVGGHFGNWEIGPRTMGELGKPVISIYRKANNPYVDSLIQKQRSTSSKAMVSKGKHAARAILKELKDGGMIGLLVDQKMNNGIAVPLFGRDAMTAPAAAEFAKKFNAPIIPFRTYVERDLHYVVEFCKPISAENKPPVEVMTEINQLLEQWIIERPDQWFWVHRRWPKES